MPCRLNPAPLIDRGACRNLSAAGVLDRTEAFILAAGVIKEGVRVE